MRMWIDFVACLLLSSVGAMGSFLVNRAVPVPDDITLLLFGTGIISSVTLIKTENPFNEGQTQDLQ